MKQVMLITTLLLGTLLSAQQASAAGSTQHSGQAVVHSVQASGHAALGAIQLTSAVVAIPLQAVGAIGAVSSQAGDALMEGAENGFSRALPVSEETITAGPPPSQALYQQVQP